MRSTRVALYDIKSGTFDEVVSAARRANAHDFIMSLPKGYDTRIGSRGVLLSGGQRQRVSLARALLRGSPILVLDEATNAIDSMTESEILESLKDLRGRTTVVVIAHRVGTTSSADQVVTLERGRVVEHGPPHELLASDGPYRRMYELQQVSLREDEL